jgi:hypothetical protein
MLSSCAHAAAPSFLLQIAVTDVVDARESFLELLATAAALQDEVHEYADGSVARSRQQVCVALLNQVACIGLSPWVTPQSVAMRGLRATQGSYARF